MPTANRLATFPSQQTLTKRIPVNCDPPCQGHSVAGTAPARQICNHEDAIYPTTKLSMIAIALVEQASRLLPKAMPAEQELKTKIRRAGACSRSWFAPSQGIPQSSRLICGEAAEYRARPAGRQLGAEILESFFRGPRGCPSHLRFQRLSFFGS